MAAGTYQAPRRPAAFVLHHENHRHQAVDRGSMGRAMNNSLDADNDYHAWMADLVSSGSTCGSNPNQDSNYVVGGNASATATTSKDAFLAIWSPMAPRYGQQTYWDTGF
jgi:hypothetical protein